MFDCVGDTTLFEKSEAYLAPKGQHISIVGGPSQGVVPFVKYRLVPRFLGGIPRSYQILGLLPSGALAAQAAKWVEDGVVKEMPIDQEFTAADLVKVIRGVPRLRLCENWLTRCRRLKS